MASSTRRRRHGKPGERPVDLPAGEPEPIDERPIAVLAVEAYEARKAADSQDRRQEAGRLATRIFGHGRATLVDMLFQDELPIVTVDKLQLAFGRAAGGAPSFRLIHSCENDHADLVGAPFDSLAGLGEVLVEFEAGECQICREEAELAEAQERIAQQEAERA